MKALIASLAVAGSGVIAACGSSSPAEVIVEPGITAIGESNALACSSELGTMQLAIEAYSALNVAPPAAESDLVPDLLRSESQLYDLVDGRIAPAPGSGCSAPPADGTERPPQATSNDESPSTNDCLARFKTLAVAIEAYYAINGTSIAATEQALVDGGLVRALDEAYDLDPDGQVFAVPGGHCYGVEVPPQTPWTLPATTSTLPVKTGECAQQRKVLEIAMDAYLAATGSPPLSESDLVPTYIRTESSDYDIVEGTITPAPASTCP